VRRWLLIASLVLALLLTGCVEIVNPQFDARYRTSTRKIETPLAVFATSPGFQGLFPLAGVDLLLVDPVTRSVTATLTVPRALSVSDVFVVGEQPRILAALTDGFAEVDLATRRVTPIDTAALPGVTVRGAAYAGDGAQILWQTAEGDLRLMVTRRLGSAQQTAAVDFRDWLRKNAPNPKQAATWSTRGLRFVTADEHAAYFVNDSPLPGRRGLTVTVWRADFASRTIVPVGKPRPWPASLPLDPRAHVERVIHRWGIPVDGGNGTTAFLSVGGRGQATLPALSRDNDNSIVFEPGGDRYLASRWAFPSSAVRGMISAEATREVSESSVATGSSVVLMSKRLGAGASTRLEPLGLVSGMLAYGDRVTGLSRPLIDSVPTDVLHLYDVAKRTDSVVTTLTSQAPSPSLDYLGSYLP
jgi:hypothetical protein